MRKRAEAKLDVNLTPLLDVVLQLITFFMMLIHFGTRIEGATQDIRLPNAPTALPGEELNLDRLVVSIDSRGALRVDGKALQGGAADAWWGEQAEHRREGVKRLGGPNGELPTQVIIRADRDAAYGAVRMSLVAAQERGFSRFTLVVLEERAP